MLLARIQRFRKYISVPEELLLKHQNFKDFTWTKFGNFFNLTVKRNYFFFSKIMRFKLNIYFYESICNKNFHVHGNKNVFVASHISSLWVHYFCGLHKPPALWTLVSYFICKEELGTKLFLRSAHSVQNYEPVIVFRIFHYHGKTKL